MQWLLQVLEHFTYMYKCIGASKVQHTWLPSCRTPVPHCLPSGKPSWHIDPTGCSKHKHTISHTLPFSIHTCMHVCIQEPGTSYILYTCTSSSTLDIMDHWLPPAWICWNSLTTTLLSYHIALLRNSWVLVHTVWCTSSQITFLKNGSLKPH